jgi:hypothetical protein
VETPDQLLGFHRDAGFGHAGLVAGSDVVVITPGSS